MRVENAQARAFYEIEAAREAWVTRARTLPRALTCGTRAGRHDAAGPGDASRASQPGRVVLIAIPLLIQSYGIFAIAYGLARLLKLPFNVAAPAAMIGTSNFFELAVAVAISLFGLASGAALATVVGVLIEVPVMLSLVAFANRTKGWFPAPSSTSA